MNSQPPEKPVFREDGALDVEQVFISIQGEGPFVGRRALFIRMAGCNLQCPGCDTAYTHDRSLLGAQELMTLVGMTARPKELIVLTGGEPFRQNLLPLVNRLTEEGYEIQVETNGTLYQDLPYKNITVVCSPKTGSLNKSLQNKIAALKYVISAADGISEEDGLPYRVLGLPSKVARPPEDFQGIVYVQPADDGSPEANAANLRLTLRSVIEFNHVLCLQVHKVINIA